MAKSGRLSNPTSVQSSESINYKVQFGRTDGFRYVGVQPPLGITDSRNFAATLDDQLGNYSFVISGSTRKPDHGSAYTEFAVMGTPDDETLIYGAQTAMKSVLAPGDSMQIDNKVRGIGYGIYLFGGQANKLG